MKARSTISSKTAIDDNVDIQGQSASQLNALENQLPAGVCDTAEVPPTTAIALLVNVWLYSVIAFAKSFLVIGFDYFLNTGVRIIAQQSDKQQGAAI
jgi:hypothetical protein